MTGASWSARGVHAIAVITAFIAIGAALYFTAGSIGLYVQNSDTVISWVLTILPWALLAGAAWAIWKRLSYFVVLPALGLCGGFVLYLIWDDSARPPSPALEHVIAKEAPSYTTYRWMLKNDPLSRLSEASTTPEIPRFTQNPDGWSAMVTKDRAAFEEAWANDALGREWVEAMAKHEPMGIFPPAGVKEPAMTFSVLRRHCMVRWGIAQLRLIDGQSDEAVRTLLPLLQASYHLQRAGTSLVTQMIANVFIHGTHQRLQLILDGNTLSASARSETLAVLRSAPAVELCIENAFIGEQFLVRSSIDSLSQTHTDLTTAFKLAAAFDDSNHNYEAVGNRFLLPLFFNPHRSEREYADFLNAASVLAQQRKLDRMNETAKAYAKKVSSWRLKNPVGQQLIAMALPAFQKVFTRLWEIEDQRLAFIRVLDP